MVFPGLLFRGILHAVGYFMSLPSKTDHLQGDDMRKRSAKCNERLPCHEESGSGCC